MNPFPWLSACAIAGSLAVGPIWAQPAASPRGPLAALSAAPGPVADQVTLREALDAAWQRAIAARESEGQRRRAEADRAVAGSFWAAPPSLELSYRSDRL